MLLLQQMTVLFIIMIIGYFSARKGILDERTCGQLSALVVNVANPALILSGSLESGQVQGTKLLAVLGLAAGLFVVLIGITWVVPSIIRIPRDKAGIYRVMSVFSNIGFMGFPVVQAMYGSEALLYASLFVIPYNLLIYTYGIAVLGEKSGFSLKKVCNIGVVSCIVSAAIALLHLELPDFAGQTITYISSLTAPLSMMIIGASMLGVQAKTLFGDKKLLGFTFIKMLVIPILGVLALKPFIKDEVILGICMVVLATPVGNMTAMLAQRYDGDFPLASRAVALTTICSVLTIPLVSVFL